jgi:serine/threonine protein kinase
MQKLGKLLGGGSYGKVYKGKFDRGGEIVKAAYKEVCLEAADKKAIARFDREVSLLKDLNNLFVVDFYGTFEGTKYATKYVFRKQMTQ